MSIKSNHIETSTARKTPKKITKHRKEDFYIGLRRNQHKYYSFHINKVSSNGKNENK